jgi:large subunit ribosomal protein L7/L12
MNILRKRIIGVVSQRRILQSQRNFSLSSAVKSDEANSSTESSEYVFQHARSKELFEKMSQLPIEDIQTLVSLINERLGIVISESDKRFAGSGAAAGVTAAVEEEEKVEKTVFDVKLTGFDSKMKIKVIKEIRAITGLGLKEAKEMVEGAESGSKVVKKDIKKEEAEELKASLEAVGATIDIS